MDKDEQAKRSGELKIVSLAGRTRRRSVCDWVQAIPGLPMAEVLQETSIILGCITALTQQALSKPKEAQTLMRATYYISGMAKAMIDGQLPVSKEQGDS